MLTVTKRFEFAYGHHLPGYDGLCKNSHGHNAIVEVEVRRSKSKKAPKPYDGMIVDFKDLKQLVKSQLDFLDHQYLNDLPDFEKINPTAENMTEVLVGALDKAFTGRGIELVRLRVSETSDSWAEWKED